MGRRGAFSKVKVNFFESQPFWQWPWKAMKLFRNPYFELLRACFLFPTIHSCHSRRNYFHYNFKLWRQNGPQIRACISLKAPIWMRAILMSLKTTPGGFEPGVVWLATARATDWAAPAGQQMLFCTRGRPLLLGHWAEQGQAVCANA